MLSVKHLKLTDFRCFQSLDLSFTDGINIIEGANGSGKTSILEAIHYLSTGKSFRSRLARYVVRESQSTCVVHATLQRGPTSVHVGLERGLDSSQNRQKLNGCVLPSVAPLAQQIPVQFIHPAKLQFLSGGPTLRRELLNWGLFYSDPEFFPLWSRLSKSIKQRNSALKQGYKGKSLSVWDDALVQLAPLLDEMRQAYITSLGDYLRPLCEQMFADDLALEWSYLRGWSKGESLRDVLQRHVQRDAALGYTQYGPHRADFVLKSRGQPAFQVLSQGQQKNLAYAILLAQMQLQAEYDSAVLLVDDLPAELDSGRINMISEVIRDMRVQTFVSAISAAELPLLTSLPHQLFHVKLTGAVTSNEVL